MSASLLNAIRFGSKVTILVHGGLSIDRTTGRTTQEFVKRTGRAVMKGPAGWVLNLGGRHGTPGIATEDNIVSVTLPRTR